MIPTTDLPATFSGVDVDLVNDPEVEEVSSACAATGELVACDAVPARASALGDELESRIRNPLSSYFFADPLGTLTAKP